MQQNRRRSFHLNSHPWLSYAQRVLLYHARVLCSTTFILGRLSGLKKSLNSSLFFGQAALTVHCFLTLANDLVTRWLSWTLGQARLKSSLPKKKNLLALDNHTGLFFEPCLSSKFVRGVSHIGHFRLWWRLGRRCIELHSYGLLWGAKFDPVPAQPRDLRSLFWSYSDRCVFAFLFQGGWDAGYLYECEFDEGKKPAPAEGQEDTRDEPIRSIPVDGSDDKPIRSVCFRWVDEKSLALR